MHIKFRVIYADDTYLDSHDEMWNVIHDHCHALPPHNEKKWKRYELISDDMGFLVGVDYETGVFNVRGQIIHPGNQNGIAYTFKTDKQDYPVDETRNILNGMPYFPIYGRRQVMGDWGSMTLFLCGWKRKIDNTTVEKIALVYPNGEILMT